MSLINLEVEPTEKSVRENSKPVFTMAHTKKQKRKKGDKDGSNVTKRATAMRRGSECFITFQRQIKQAKRVWDREMEELKRQNELSNKGAKQADQKPSASK